MVLGKDMIRQKNSNLYILNGLLKRFINLVDRDGIGWVERFMGDCCRKRGKGSATFHGKPDMNGNHFHIEAGSHMGQPIVEPKVKVCFLKHC